MGLDHHMGHSERDFLAFCEKLEENASGWETLKVGFSKNLNPRDILRDRDAAAGLLKTARENALYTFNDLNNKAKILKTEAVSYIFTDNDILLFADIKSPETRDRLNLIGLETRETLPPNVCIDHLVAKQHLPGLKKFADEKLRTARQMRVMTSLASDAGHQDAIPARRKNRNLPLVMLVEDDRFTAAYTIQLLSKDYEVFHVRTGEEAIEYYIDYAPDAVFIDMHLPGMSGIDTLHMIRAMDPSAYCVIQSVDTSHATVMAASEDGVNGYLRKPYNKERLLWTVRQSPHIHGCSAGCAKNLVTT